MTRAPIRAVVVAFDRVSRMDIARALRRGGFEVVEEETHKEGLWHLMEEPPDVLLMERVSPDCVDVIERLAAMRLELAVTQTVVFLLSRDEPTASDLELSREVGSISFLSNPESLGEIVARARQAVPAFTALTPVPFTPPPRFDTLDREEVREGLAIKHKLSRELGGLRRPSPPPRRFQEEVISDAQQNQPEPSETEDFRLPGPPAAECREHKVEQRPPGSPRRQLRETTGLRMPSPPPRAYREERPGEKPRPAPAPKKNKGEQSSDEVRDLLKGFLTEEDLRDRVRRRK